MTDKQPEALRLAELMTEKPDSDGHCMKAAAELRRQHALCDEMGEALERIERWVREADEECGTGFNWQAINEDEGEQARAALAKWKESK